MGIRPLIYTHRRWMAQSLMWLQLQGDPLQQCPQRPRNLCLPKTRGERFCQSPCPAGYRIVAKASLLPIFHHQTRKEVIYVGFTNKRQGSQKPVGFTNGPKVRCPKCGTSQFLRPGSGPWKCVSCKKTN